MGKSSAFPLGHNRKSEAMAAWSRRVLFEAVDCKNNSSERTNNAKR
jgi:hypothetical protein